MAELLTYYVIASLLFVGAPAIFFIIVFMPALQNTKGRMVGYKDHINNMEIPPFTRTLQEIKLNFTLNFRGNI